VAIEKSSSGRPAPGGLPLPAVIVLGALAILGAITLVQWALSAVLGLVRFAILIVIVIAVGAWVVSAKANRQPS
jgi:hypothetical protein